MMGTHIHPVGPAYRCCLHTQQIHKWRADTRTYHLFPVGSPPGANSDPDMGVQRSKSLFCQVHPLLFIHETKKKGWREGARWRGIPQREAFDVENKISVLICPLMKYTWCILSLYTAIPLSLFVFVFTCLSLRVLRTHTWFSWCSTRVQDRRRMR